ncbi:MAG: hypothetical protein KGL46_08105 [Hyphomicrobiales bacterium]|nr:hypothetical protein [Hyphomicrobiales bacterium]
MSFPFNAALARATLGLLFALAGAQGLAARAPNDVEKTELTQRIGDFVAANKERDYPKVISFMPPRVIETFAGATKMQTDELRMRLADAMRTVETKLKLIDYKASADKATFKELPDGGVYALVPTQATVDIEGKARVRNESWLIALRDLDRWYFVNADESNQVLILRKAYPEFATQDLPRGEMRLEKEQPGKNAK